jgi:hypothetical protein
MSRLTELLTEQIEQAAGESSEKAARVIEKINKGGFDKKNAEHLLALANAFLEKGSCGASTTEMYTLGFALGEWKKLGGSYKNDPFECWTNRLSNSQREFVKFYREKIKNGKE